MFTFSLTDFGTPPKRIGQRSPADNENKIQKANGVILPRKNKVGQRMIMQNWQIRREDEPEIVKKNKK